MSRTWCLLHAGERPRPTRRLPAAEHGQSRGGAGAVLAARGVTGGEPAGERPLPAVVRAAVVGQRDGDARGGIAAPPAAGAAAQRPAARRHLRPVHGAGVRAPRTGVAARLRACRAETDSGEVGGGRRRRRRRRRRCGRVV